MLPWRLIPSRATVTQFTRAALAFFDYEDPYHVKVGVRASSLRMMGSIVARRWGGEMGTQRSTKPPRACSTPAPTSNQSPMIERNMKNIWQLSCGKILYFVFPLIGVQCGL